MFCLQRLVESAYTLRDETVAVKNGDITVRTVVPVVADERETFPVFVNIHGGGTCGELRCPVL